jgi:putative membrane protein
MMDGGMGIWMVFNMIFWLLIIIGVVFLIFWTVNKVKRAEQKPEEESALDILKKRYASGEIDKEEFEEKKKNLL